MIESTTAKAGCSITFAPNLLLDRCRFEREKTRKRSARDPANGRPKMSFSGPDRRTPRGKRARHRDRTVGRTEREPMSIVGARRSREFKSDTYAVFVRRSECRPDRLYCAACACNAYARQNLHFSRVRPASRRRDRIGESGRRSPARRKRGKRKTSEKRKKKNGNESTTGEKKKRTRRDFRTDRSRRGAPGRMYNSAWAIERKKKPNLTRHTDTTDAGEPSILKRSPIDRYGNARTFRESKCVRPAGRGALHIV